MENIQFCDLPHLLVSVMIDTIVTKFASVTVETNITSVAKREIPWFLGIVKELLEKKSHTSPHDNALVLLNVRRVSKSSAHLDVGQEPKQPFSCGLISEVDNFKFFSKLFGEYRKLVCKLPRDTYTGCILRPLSVTGVSSM